MKTIYLISPHLDDAFFSAGGLMLKLLNEKKKVTVINVFSKSGEEPQTLSAKAFLSQVQEKDVKSLYKKRNIEDQKVLTSQNIEVLYLNEVEALWRKKEELNPAEKVLGKLLPELNHVYPIYRLHIINGKVRAADSKIIKRISQKIADLTKDASIIICPIGIGGHVDHLAVKQACEMLNLPLVYWADIPYKNREGQNLVPAEVKGLETCIVSNKQLLRKKDQLAKGYVTQYHPVFGDTSCDTIDEQFFASKENLKKLFN